MNSATRREFLMRSAAAAAIAGLAATADTQAEQARRMPPLCVFSKHLQFLDYPALARTCREVGLDGVDLTVRPGGHVLPERVASDLPAAVEAIRAEGLDVPMITTRFVSGNDEGVGEILRTAKACGIPYFRIGSHRYDANGPILPQLARYTEEVRGLAEIAEEMDMTAGYHNHSGMHYVGAPLWDLCRMYEAIDSPRVGSNFDVGHAMVEGAYGDWQITARLLAPWVRMVAVKDFVFDGNRPRWMPLGEGIVNVAGFLGIFREHAAFAGPISLHFEYRVPSNDAMIESVAHAVRHMRDKVYPEAGYTG